MASTIEQNGAVTVINQAFDLFAPIAAMAQTSVQQNHRLPFAIAAIPELCPSVLEPCLLTPRGQTRISFGLKTRKIIIVIEFHHSSPSPRKR